MTAKKAFNKFDQGKARPDLIPKGFLMEMGRVMKNGVDKYGEDNWQNCDDPRRYQAAMMRHMLAYLDGERVDPDSGFSTLAHLACSTAMAFGLDEILKAAEAAEEDDTSASETSTKINGREIFKVLEKSRTQVLNTRKSVGCNLFLEHVRETICGGSNKRFHYVMAWAARAMQNIDGPGGVAIVLRGPQGTGKTTFASTLGHLFGNRFLHVKEASRLGIFSKALQDVSLLFLDTDSSNRQSINETKLLSLMAAPTLMLEAKGEDPYVVQNCLHLILSVLPGWEPPKIGSDKFLILDISDNRQGDHKYFSKIQEQMSCGGHEALMGRLLNDLSDFDVHNLDFE